MPLIYFFTGMLLLAFPAFSYGQNLVPNAGFEDYTACPSNFGSIPFSNDYANFPVLKNWTNPVKLSSPDYLNTCATGSSGLNVPASTFGFQQPLSGAGYGGIIAFQGSFSGGNLTYDYREYLQNRLSSPMKAGRQYCVSFYVNPAISPNFSFNYISLDEIGIYFSAGRPLDSTHTYLSFPFHIKNTSGSFLTDTSKWYRVSGVYQAQGGEEWLTLGCFKSNNAAPSFVKAFPGPFNPNVLFWSYLFIEDVSVTEITSTDTLINRKDTVVCQTAGLQIPFSGQENALKYQWQDGSASRNFMVSDTGTFWCISKMECSLVIDSFYIHYRPYKKLDLGKDTFNCQLQPVSLSANHVYNEYLWNTGDTTPSLTVYQSGVFILTVRDSCGIQADTIEAGIQAPVPPPSLSDTVLCQNDPSPVLNTSGSGLKWYFPNVAEGLPFQPHILTSAPGIQTFWVSQTIGHCESIKKPVSIIIKYKPDADLNEYYFFCEESDSILEKTYPGVRYLWNTGEETFGIRPQYSGKYWLTISNDCGSSADTTYVEVSSCEDCLAVPNAFTPNGDGKNDFFAPVIKCPVRHYSLKIFNRWGMLVFESKNPLNGWSGRNFSGRADAGAYVYLIEYYPENGYQKKILQGNLTLLR